MIANNKHRRGVGSCLLCGEQIEYLEQAEEMKCVFCHTIKSSNAKCQDDHYVCDACHSEKGIEAIKEIALTTSSRNPITIAKSMMNHSFIYMHGPEHHVLVGASLLAAYANCGSELSLELGIDEMIQRGKQVPGGVCGLHGCCGAAVSTGIFYSIITNCNPLNQGEWGNANLMTASALTAIGQYSGPRCCKRDSFTAIVAAVEYIKLHKEIEMELPNQIVCGYYEENNECLKEQCSFYPDGNRVV